MIKQREANSWKSVSYVKSITGAQTYTKFPIVLRTTEQSIPIWSMDGNTETGENPSPQNPIVINGVGEKTVNLFNEVYPNIDSNVRYLPLQVGDGTFTLTTTCPQSSDPAALLFLLSGNVDSGASSSTNGVWNGQNRTVSATGGYVTIGYRALSGTSPVNYQTMLVKGSTVPSSYEPFGYKIPLSSNGTALSPMYLTEQLMEINNTTDSLVSTGTVTYSIKKFVLTGQEGWNYYSEVFYMTITGYLHRQAAMAICTHYPCNESISEGSAALFGVSFYRWDTNNRLYIKDSQFTSLTDFTTFLQQQYANGTPVTIYYILATPTTEQVTVPTIPTTSGLNTIDVDTSVKPSEMSLTYDGYKICKPKRKSENLLDMSQSVYGEGLTAGIGATTPTFAPSAVTSHSGMIKVKSNTEYTIKLSEAPTTARSIYMYDSLQAFVRVYPTQQSTISLTITTGATEEYIIFGYNIDDTQAMLVEGSTAPSEFVPYWE